MPYQKFSDPGLIHFSPVSMNVVVYYPAVFFQIILAED